MSLNDRQVSDLLNSLSALPRIADALETINTSLIHHSAEVGVGLTQLRETIDNLNMAISDIHVTHHH